MKSCFLAAPEALRLQARKFCALQGLKTLVSFINYTHESFFEWE